MLLSNSYNYIIDIGWTSSYLNNHNRGLMKERYSKRKRRKRKATREYKNSMRIVRWCKRAKEKNQWNPTPKKKSM
jgi:hypothetical protein